MKNVRMTLYRNTGTGLIWDTPHLRKQRAKTRMRQSAQFAVIYFLLLDNL